MGQMLVTQLTPQHQPLTVAVPCQCHHTAATQYGARAAHTLAANCPSASPRRQHAQLTAWPDNQSCSALTDYTVAPGLEDAAKQL